MHPGLLLSEQLPLTFKGTDFSFDEMTCRCSKCNVVIPDDLLSATVTRVIESLAEIKGEAACPCGEVEKFTYRVRSDATMQVLTLEGWQEYSLVPQPNVTDRVIDYMKKRILLKQRTATLLGIIPNKVRYR